MGDSWRKKKIKEDPQIAPWKGTNERVLFGLVETRALCLRQKELVQTPFFSF
jgi:hypothetical protein